MAKILNIALEMSDEEYTNFLARIAERGTIGGDEDNETGNETPSNADVSGQVDADGVPWNAQWHSSAKSLSASGKWRGVKGRDAKAYAAALPSLKAAAGQATQTQAAPASLPQTAISGLPAGAMPGLPSGMPGMPGMPQTQAAPPPVSFEQVVAKYNELSGAQKITMEQVNSIYANAGVTDPAELMTNETLRRKVFDGLAAFG